MKSRFLISTFIFIALVSLSVFAVPVEAQIDCESAIDPNACAEAENSSTVTTFLNALKNIGINAVLGLFGVVGVVITLLLGQVMRLAGIAMNASFQYFVIGMADLVNSNSAVNIAWAVMRDIANAVFLFLLIWIGLQTILRAASYPWKRAIGMIIAAAILVNFSMILTKVVIDVSNVMAVEIYTSMSPALASCAPASDANMQDCLNIGISNFFQNFLSVNSLMKISGYSGENLFFASMVSIILHTISIFVFFASALFIMTRFAVLVLVIIFSPIAFAATVIPGLRHIWKKWIDHLIKQSFFAPAFLLMLWLSLKTLEAINTGGSAAANALSSQPDMWGALTGSFTSGIAAPTFQASTISAYMLYGLTAMFLILSLTVARMAGIYTSSTVIGWGNNWRRGLWTGTKNYTRNARNRAVGAAGRAMERNTDITWEEAKKDKKLMGAYILSRPVAWTPGGKRGVQHLGKLYDADIDRMAKKHEKFTTRQLASQVGSGKFTLPNERAAILKTAMKRGEVHQLPSAFTQSAIGIMDRNGLNTEEVYRQAPHLIQNTSDENLKKIILRQKPSDIENIDYKSLKDNEANRNKIFESMAKHFKGHQAAAMMRDLDDKANAFMQYLANHAGGSGSRAEIAAWLRRPEISNQNLAKWIESNAGRNVMGEGVTPDGEVWR